ncbi:hypothetical protein IU449_26905 [Nocardia higoensis]|uniref:Uncharacterized protein n=1 Tax=Nocardia higoensis TaxID=228599 RepID=A0ABS0DJ19_9NOCA|nr:hypothetical protein [Nocardia higoensis]MBF6358130.1 hypothetical protein [Nocardia higoensis]
MSDLYAASKRDFLGYAKHLDGMTIHLDQGLYRHIQFGTRGQVGWFEIITWPHRLSITGDIGDWTFGRIEDMFEFFGHSAESSIQPDYWAEKIVAGTAPLVFSEEAFRRQVVTEFWYRRDRYEGESADLFRQIREDVLECAWDEPSALRSADTFRYVSHHSGRQNFTFRDSWEWNIRDHSVHYLRACQAIVWGIAQYRAHKAAASKEAAA